MTEKGVCKILTNILHVKRLLRFVRNDRFGKTIQFQQLTFSVIVSLCPKKLGRKLAMTNTVFVIFAKLPCRFLHSPAKNTVPAFHPPIMFP
jgi:hypothetical protein